MRYTQTDISHWLGLEIGSSVEHKQESERYVHLNTLPLDLTTGVSVTRVSTGWRWSMGVQEANGKEIRVRVFGLHVVLPQSDNPHSI